MERVPVRIAEDILKELKSSTFYDFAFHKEDLIHAMQRKGYLNIVRNSSVIAGILPGQSGAIRYSIPSGHVYVAYDMQIDVSVPFALFFLVNTDNNFHFATYSLPSIFSWKNIGWLAIKDEITMSFRNIDPISTVWLSMIARYLDFETERWYEFEENFLHPLEYYVTKIMEGEKPEEI